MKFARRTCLAALVALLSGCGVGSPLTPEGLAEARRAWERADVQDYDLEWTSTGAQRGHYRVAVRSGRVRDVKLVEPDGRVVEAHPGDPSFFGVPGLFRVIAFDLDQRLEPRPFHQPPGTHILMRCEFDPRYGYPRRYRRDVAGTRLGLAIDVLAFAPREPDAPPAP
jgi:hypothetical protein